MRRVKDTIKAKSIDEQFLHERRAVVHAIVAGAKTIEAVSMSTGLTEERVAEVVRHMQTAEAWPGSRWPVKPQPQQEAR
jgi:hypothetical protein